MHSRSLPGKPDFAFPDERLAVFVDGCYWHGCPKCYKPPSSNSGYWSQKLQRNKDRDRIVSAKLRREGWRIMRIWEHEVKKSPQRVIAKIHKKLTELQAVGRNR